MQSKGESEPLMGAVNPARSPSIDKNINVKIVHNSSSVGVVKKNWKYGYWFVLAVMSITLQTILWRLFLAPLCGSFCNLNSLKEKLFSEVASSNIYDYSEFGQKFQYPAGVIYFYDLINNLDYSETFRSYLPLGIYFYFLFLATYLMKRCRIEPVFLLFFVVPLGLLLQGQALMFLLPDILGMALLLQALLSIISGYQKTGIFVLIGAMSLDMISVLPVVPALVLCLMRTMGARCAILWTLLAFAGFGLISGNYLLANPSAYLTQCFGLQPRESVWNPLIWFIHVFNISKVDESKLRQFTDSVIPGVVIQVLAQVSLINFRWLRSDGGIAGLVTKFMRSTRGYGIRPNPWTPRQTLSVIFEAMLVSMLLRFPSLAHAEEFELIPVVLSGFFCIALAEPVPLPALFGAMSALTFPLSFLYRRFTDEIELDGSLQFYPNLRESLHFLPMLFLPIAQLSILCFFKRKDISGPAFTSSVQKSPNSVFSSPNSAQKGFSSYHHRRSSSLSRRKID